LGDDSYISDELHVFDVCMPITDGPCTTDVELTMLPADWFSYATSDFPAYEFYISDELYVVDVCMPITDGPCTTDVELTLLPADWFSYAASDFLAYEFYISDELYVVDVCMPITDGPCTTDVELTMLDTDWPGYTTSDLPADDFYISELHVLDVCMPGTEGPGYNDGFLDFMRSVTANYRESPASVHVDLNLQDGVTAQSGGDPGNTADGDVLQNILWLFGSNFDDTLVCAKNAGAVTNIFAEDGNDTIYGDGGIYWLYGGAGDDVLYGALGHSFRSLHGDAGDDILHLNLNGKDFFGGESTILPGHIGALDGGDGFDTLVLDGRDGDGVTLDLSRLAKAGTITGIERLDITGDADDANTLTLKASDVLDTTDGANTLWVRGDGNDTVTTTDTGWTHVGVETGADGQQYNHYSGYVDSTLVNLMIDADLANQNIVHS